MMDFVAIDVETANPDWSSICQIGLVEFSDGRPLKRFSCFVNPNDYFDDINTSIHGIAAEHVADARTYAEHHDVIVNWLNGRIVAHHMPFDRVALTRASAKAGCRLPPITWLDTARVVRRAWVDAASAGYGLQAMCVRLGIPIDGHHDAGTDAYACGQLLIHASEVTSTSVEAWVDRVNQPISGVSYRDSVVRDGDPEGILYGETLVFTGALAIARKDASALAARAGCNVSDTVTKKTTILVVGVQDLRRTLGRERSAKHRKADRLVGKGQHIKIIGEDDFLELVAIPTGGTASA